MPESRGCPSRVKKAQVQKILALPQMLSTTENVYNLRAAAGLSRPIAGLRIRMFSC